MKMVTKTTTKKTNFSDEACSLGRILIWGTIFICISIGLITFLSAGGGAAIFAPENTPNGTVAKIFLSKEYANLIITLCIPFTIGIVAGIILIISSRTTDIHISEEKESDNEFE